MNDEIKEILDEYITDNDWIVIATNVLKYLKDYITNLQKENKILKDNAIHNDRVVDKARWNEKVYKLGIEKVSEILKQTCNMLQKGDDEK